MESVIALSETLLDPVTERTMAEWLEGARTVLTQDPTTARSLADRIVRAAAAANAAAILAKALALRGRAHGALGDIDAANADLCEALERARVLADRHTEANCLHGLAGVYYHRGDYLSALEAIHQSVAMRREIGDEPGLMDGLNSMGAIHQVLGSFPEAVTNLTDALQIARRLEDTGIEAMALANIGIVKVHCGEPEQAIEYLIQSVQLLDKIGERVRQSLCQSVLARAYHLTHRLPEALASALIAVHLAVEVGNQHHEVTALPTLAMIQADLGETSTAERSLLRALDIALTIESGNMIADIYRSLGQHYLKTSNLTCARHYVEKGFEYAQEAQQNLHLSELYSVSCEIYEAQEDYKRALEAYRAYTEADRAQQKESAQNRMIAQLAQLDVERAQQEAEIHRLRNVELVAADREKADLLLQLQQHAEQLAQLAITDPLTGLYNRRYLEEYLTQEIRTTRHPDVYLGVAMVDLDNFKQVNDQFGHHTGDEVLQATADLLQKTLRRIDIVVRNGGEEFVLLLPGADVPAAVTACERVRTAIEGYDWSVIASGLHLTVSIGLCHSSETDTLNRDSAGRIDVAGNRVGAGHRDAAGHDLGPFLVRADQRLYQAKALGKNRVIGSAAATFGQS